MRMLKDLIYLLLIVRIITVTILSYGIFLKSPYSL